MATSAQVPGRFDCALDGNNFMIDKSTDDAFRRQSIPMLRNQADGSSEFGEASLNPEDLSRASMESWTHGAGQVFRDREESDRRRFRSSKGVDVWETWELSLLPSTSNKRAAAGSNQRLCVIGDYLYMAHGTELVHTTSLTGSPTWTGVGMPADPPVDVCSDGYYAFTAHGAGGIYGSVRGSITSTQRNTVPTTRVDHVNGRLMGSYGPDIFNITSTSPPTYTFTHPNADWEWVGFTEGDTAIYAAGFSGDKSLVYRIGILSGGTGLDAPIVAGRLPDGEVVTGIGSYQGLVLLGSTLGVRLCSTNSDGSLTVGSLIRTDEPAYCFEGQDKYVWFGWGPYDSTSSGLGRLDLQNFTAPLTPAYASDLMATAQGAVTSVVTFGGKRVFTVDTVGAFAEGEDKVASGDLYTGLITYGIPDDKVAIYLDVLETSGDGTYAVELGVNGGSLSTPFTGYLTRSDPLDLTSPFLAGEMVGRTHEIHLALTRDAVLTETGPNVARVTLRAYPRPSRGEVWQVPVLVRESVDDRAGGQYTMVPDTVIDTLRDLQTSRALVPFQMGSATHTVLVEDYVIAYDKATSDGAFNATVLLRLKAPGV